MPPKDDISYAKVVKLLDYDPLTGILRWKTARKRRCEAGDVAGATCCDGYRTISINGKAYKAHRLAWLLHTGKWPTDQLDHINRNRSDNRIDNLREVDQSTNKINTYGYKNNKSGYRGVYFYAPTNKWQAQLRRNNKTVSLGYFATAEAAHQRRVEELNR